MTPVILDTGPLVALLYRRDAHHEWAKNQFGKIEAPLLTCDAVLTEACFLLRKAPNGASNVMKMVEAGVVRPCLHLEKEGAPIRTLMDKFSNVPMSLADACLVRMTEIYHGSSVLTLDSDFSIYRKNGNESIVIFSS
jgi:predicted nucleic acid-binding protein